MKKSVSGKTKKSKRGKWKKKNNNNDFTGVHVLHSQWYFKGVHGRVSAPPLSLQECTIFRTRNDYKKEKRKKQDNKQQQRSNKQQTTNNDNNNNEWLQECMANDNVCTLNEFFQECMDRYVSAPLPTIFTGVHSKWHAALPPFRCWSQSPTPPPLFLFLYTTSTSISNFTNNNVSTVAVQLHFPFEVSLSVFSGFYKFFPRIITYSNLPFILQTTDKQQHYPSGHHRAASLSHFISLKSWRRQECVGGTCFFHASYWYWAYTWTMDEMARTVTCRRAPTPVHFWHGSYMPASLIVTSRATSHMVEARR